MGKITNQHLYVLWSEKFFNADSGSQRPTTQQIIDAMKEAYNLAVENVASEFVSNTRDKILSQKI